jgi:hypothetical protein
MKWKGKGFEYQKTQTIIIWWENYSRERHRKKSKNSKSAIANGRMKMLWAVTLYVCRVVSAFSMSDGTSLRATGAMLKKIARFGFFKKKNFWPQSSLRIKTIHLYTNGFIRYEKMIMMLFMAEIKRRK